MEDSGEIESTGAEIGSPRGANLQTSDDAPFPKSSSVPRPKIDILSPITSPDRRGSVPDQGMVRSPSFSLAFEDDPVDMSAVGQVVVERGYIWKRSHKALKRFKKHWFNLQGHHLCWFKDGERETEEKGRLPLDRCVVALEEEAPALVAPAGRPRHHWRVLAPNLPALLPALLPPAPPAAPATPASVPRRRWGSAGGGLGSEGRRRGSPGAAAAAAAALEGEGEGEGEARRQLRWGSPRAGGAAAAASSSSPSEREAAGGGGGGSGSGGGTPFPPLRASADPSPRAAAAAAAGQGPGPGPAARRLTRHVSGSSTVSNFSASTGASGGGGGRARASPGGPRRLDRRISFQSEDGGYRRLRGGSLSAAAAQQLALAALLAPPDDPAAAAAAAAGAAAGGRKGEDRPYTVYEFCSDTAEERARWVRKIQAAIQEADRHGRLRLMEESPGGGGGGGGRRRSSVGWRQDSWLTAGGGEEEGAAAAAAAAEEGGPAGAAETAGDADEPNSIAGWLTSLNLDQLEPKFSKNGYYLMSSLIEEAGLSRDLLDRVGVRAPLHRRVLRTALSQYAAAGPPPPPPPSSPHRRHPPAFTVRVVAFGGTSAAAAAAVAAAAAAGGGGGGGRRSEASLSRAEERAPRAPPGGWVDLVTSAGLGAAPPAPPPPQGGPAGAGAAAAAVPGPLRCQCRCRRGLGELEAFARWAGAGARALRDLLAAAAAAAAASSASSPRGGEGGGAEGEGLPPLGRLAALLGRGASGNLWNATDEEEHFTPSIKDVLVWLSALLSSLWALTNAVVKPTLSCPVAAGSVDLQEKEIASHIKEILDYTFDFLDVPKQLMGVYFNSETLSVAEPADIELVDVSVGSSQHFHEEAAKKDAAAVTISGNDKSDSGDDDEFVITDVVSPP